MVSLSNVFAILVLAGLSAALAWFALLLLVGLVFAGLAVLLVRPILAALLLPRIPLLLPRIALLAIFHVVFPVFWTALLTLVLIASSRLHRFESCRLDKCFDTTSDSAGPS